MGYLQCILIDPAPLIGFHGERVDRFKQKLLALPIYHIKEVRLEETHGIF